MISWWHMIYMNIGDIRSRRDAFRLPCACFAVSESVVDFCHEEPALKWSIKMVSRKKCSPIWAFFKDPVDKRVECKQCEKKLANTGGTTAMREHMKRAHPLLIEGPEGKSTKSKESSLLNHVAVTPIQAPVSDTTSKEIPTGSSKICALSA